MKIEPRSLKADWPDGTKFMWCDDDDTPFAFVRVSDGWRVFLPDGSERRGLCNSTPGSLTREEFDRAAQAWVYGYTGWMAYPNSPKKSW